MYRIVYYISIVCFILGVVLKRSKRGFVGRIIRLGRTVAAHIPPGD
jgi:hypothetical protein